MPECFVANASDLKDGERRIVVSGKHEVGVFFKDGEYYAYSNYCVHAGGPACEGILVNKVVDLIAADRTYEGQTFSDELHFVCPWHGYEYDIKTGEWRSVNLQLLPFDFPPPAQLIVEDEELCKCLGLWSLEEI